MSSVRSNMGEMASPVEPNHAVVVPRRGFTAHKRVGVEARPLVTGKNRVFMGDDFDHGGTVAGDDLFAALDGWFEVGELLDLF